MLAASRRLPDLRRQPSLDMALMYLLMSVFHADPRRGLLNQRRLERDGKAQELDDDVPVVVMELVFHAGQ